MRVRVRLGAGLSRLSTAPLLAVALPDGATVGDLYTRLGETDPGLAPASTRRCRSSLGEHVPRDRTLHDRQEVAPLPPVSGG